jgi:hypothetical protein
MVSSYIKRVDVECFGEVFHCSGEIVEAIFGDASKEVAFKIVGFGDDSHIEVAYCLGIVFFRQVDTSHQYVMFVIELRISVMGNE